MAMTSEDARRWVSNFEAAEARQREETQAHPPSAESAIQGALALVALAGRFVEEPALESPQEREDELRAYECWSKLRAAAGKP